MEVPPGQLQHLGVQCIAYLDDWLVWGETREQCEVDAHRVVQILEHLGFIVNFSKSQLTPSQELDWLGVTWNSR